MKRKIIQIKIFNYQIIKIKELMRFNWKNREKGVY